MLAGRFGLVPHAGGVGVATSLSGVLSLALALARRVVEVEDAHDDFLLALRRLELRAGLLALADNSVEHTFGLGAAAVSGEAGRFALGGAGRSVGVEFAGGVSSAVALGSITALAHALGGSVGVDAGGIVVAVSLGGVAVGALSHALAGLTVPHAHTVGGTVTVVVSSVALAAALVAEGIPLATVVGVAGGLRSVGFNALGDAAKRRRVLAER